MEDEQPRQAGVESSEQGSQVEKQTARNPPEESSRKSMDESESASLSKENEIESAGSEGVMEDEQPWQAGVESSEQGSQVEKQTARNTPEESSRKSMDESESASLSEENEIEFAGGEDSEMTAAAEEENGQTDAQTSRIPAQLQNLVKFLRTCPDYLSAYMGDIEMMQQRAEREGSDNEGAETTSESDNGLGSPNVLGVSSGVEEHGEDKDLNLLNAAYFLTKGEHDRYEYFLARAWNRDALYNQKSPMDNNVLHVAAYYGNDELADEVARRHNHLLTAKNWKGDTPLHVAAKAGRLTTLRTMLATRIHFNMLRGHFEILREILAMNDSGNTFFHEAISNGHTGVMNMPLDDNLLQKGYKEFLELAALFLANKEKKSGLYLTIQAGNKQAVEHALAMLTAGQHLLLDPYTRECLIMTGLITSTTSSFMPPPGKSPMLAAIMKQDLEILEIILKEKPEWIHLMDTEGRIPLHYAASIGFLDGVLCLLEKCFSCVLKRDEGGFFPLHLASRGGHLKIVEHMVKSCPDATEMLDKKGRNIFHIAAQSGQLNVVRYILGNPELKKMINEKDVDGNTALHLATLKCHPMIVHTLTWNKEVVDLDLVNGKHRTALDLVLKATNKNPTLKQRLTWDALKSAGAQHASDLPQDSIKFPSLDKDSKKKKKTPNNAFQEKAKPKTNTEQFKDRINTLVVVSTLIITATFAAGFTMPGGNDDSEQGTARMLNRTLYHLYIFCITISLYGAISVTIILVLAQVGDLTLMLMALKLAAPLLGITLTTLSLAFMAGVYLVISKLNWLAITFLVMSSIFIVVLLSFYMLLWLPSSSSIPALRYLSYYPFRLLAWRAEAKKTTHKNEARRFK